MLLLQLACALAALASAPPSGDTFWHETLAPHFQVRHQPAFLPPGFVLQLEKIHNHLRMDLSMFSPWMAKERLKLYFYADRDSYLKGELKPPGWSNGIAFHKEKIVAVYDQANRPKLFQIIAHETTHLLFEGYWWESGKAPPQWLNEGLAMMEEADDPRLPEKSEWFQTMALLNPEHTIPFKQFAEIRPTTDLKDNSNKDAVSLWYVQAFSIVHFLYREHSRLQFQNFCNQLRDGKDLEKVIWQVYRYSGSEELDRAWRAWLKKPSTVARMRRFLSAANYKGREDTDAAPPQRGSRVGPGGTLRQLKPTGFGDFSYDNLQSK